MKALKSILINILVSIVSITLLLVTTEGLVRLFKTDSARTYFDEQVRKSFGDAAVPKKKEGEYRIVVFGGSSAYGFPVSERYSISAWLRKSFESLLPDHEIVVINCGWPGKSSFHVLEGARSVMKYEPDLFIVYSGHNEFMVSNRLFKDNALYRLNLRMKYMSTAYRYLGIRMDRVRKKIRYGSSGYAEKTYREEEIAKRVYARIEVDNAEYDHIVETYRKNMEELIAVAEKRKVEMVFVAVPSNLKDIPPAYSYHETALDEDRLKEWTIHFETGQQFEGEQLWVPALEAYERATALDDTYAELAYRMAVVAETLGSYETAREFYIKARDLDGQPWRAKSAINHTIRELAAEHELMLADAPALFEKVSPHGIVGSNIIHDNVHPSVEAQQLISDEILREISEEGLIAPEADWDWDALKENREGKDREVWAIDKSDNAYRYILRGLHLWEQNRYEEVIKDLEKGIELMPSYYESYAFLGDAYWHRGQVEKSLGAFETLKEINAAMLDQLLTRYPAIAESYSGALKQSAPEAPEPISQ